MNGKEEEQAHYEAFGEEVRNTINYFKEEIRSSQEIVRRLGSIQRRTKSWVSPTDQEVEAVYEAFADLNQNRNLANETIIRVANDFFE